MPTNVDATASQKALAKRDDNRMGVSLLVACVGLCLINLAVVLTYPVMAEAVELIGQH